MSGSIRIGKTAKDRQPFQDISDWEGFDATSFEMVHSLLSSSQLSGVLI